MQARGGDDKSEICQHFIRAARISGVKKGNGDKREECSPEEESENRKERERGSRFCIGKKCLRCTHSLRGANAARRGYVGEQFRSSRINRDERKRRMLRGKKCKG